MTKPVPVPVSRRACSLLARAGAGTPGRQPRPGLPSLVPSVWLILLAVFQPLPGLALATAADCANAARRAAAAHDVPDEILVTIAMIESGRGGDTGWPWTVGHRGSGHWAASQAEAMAQARHLIAAGERNLDIGCFQINLHWHASAFPSLEAMFDPDTNADHAARLLAGHHARTGDWDAAVAAYHSLTPAHAARYLARFRAALGTPARVEPATDGESTAPRTLSLLDDGAVSQAPGSIVRAGRLGRRLIGGAP